MYQSRKGKGEVNEVMGREERNGEEEGKKWQKEGLKRRGVKERERKQRQNGVKWRRYY